MRYVSWRWNNTDTQAVLVAASKSNNVPSLQRAKIRTAAVESTGTAGRSTKKTTRWVLAMQSELRESWSEQYQLPCVCVEAPDFVTYHEVACVCDAIGAIRREDGIEYVVELRPDIGPELWTDESLRRSVGKKLPTPTEPRGGERK